VSFDANYATKSRVKYNFKLTLSFFKFCPCISFSFASLLLSVELYFLIPGLFSKFEIIEFLFLGAYSGFEYLF
jgi:hypothetical protein